MKQIETEHYKRITKAAARKIYNANGEIYICGHNVNPEFSGGLLVGPLNTFYDFDRVINNAFYYNTDSERGWYLAYYIKKEGITE